ncbi:MAG TPA: ABC transporter permease [Candidatus Saccharibacteria bacterium]|nr:ABC transporter permease [Candidatus Saccharibacteria bacterium]
MFKNMFKRSGLSIIRKPSRSLILVIILFVMANMLLATVAIMNSVAKSTQYAKEQIGGTVYLQPDTAALREAAQKARENGETVTTTQPTISEEIAKGIANSDYIKDYTYSIATSANANGYEVVETAQNEREQQFRDALNNAQDQADERIQEFNQSRDQFNQEQSESESTQQGGGQGPGAAGGSRGTPPQFNFDLSFNFSDPSLSRGDTTIQGINSFAFITDVESGSMKIVEGEAFDESTENGVVISKELADANNLSVGSEIKFNTTADTVVELTFKIVGIYETSTEDFNNNTVYTNIDSAKKFMTDDQLKELSLQNVRYYLASAEDKDAFLAETATNYPTLATDNLKLDIDDSSYQTMVGPIESVGSFATTVFWVVVAATVAIVTLIVIINVKDRRYEMGVLLSLGAKRMNIIGQIFIELVVVGTVGFFLSLGTSQLIAQQMGNSLLQQQVASTQQTASDTTSQRGANARPGGFGSMTSQQSNAKQIDTIDVSAGVREYALLFGVGYLILVVAMIMPSINILRYQPKTILTGKE